MKYPLDKMLDMEIKRECLLDGQIVPYDACSSYSLESAQAFYAGKYDYIGSSFTYYINGVANNCTVLHHFFISKP